MEGVGGRFSRNVTRRGIQNTQTLAGQGVVDLM